MAGSPWGGAHLPPCRQSLQPPRSLPGLQARGRAQGRPTQLGCSGTPAAQELAETVRAGRCFKLQCFGVTCYAAIGNSPRNCCSAGRSLANQRARGAQAAPCVRASESRLRPLHTLPRTPGSFPALCGGRGADAFCGGAGPGVLRRPQLSRSRGGSAPVSQSQRRPRSSPPTSGLERPTKGMAGKQRPIGW